MQGRWQGVQPLSRAWEGHLLPQLSASSHVRTLDKSHGFSGSRRPGPTLPPVSLDPGLCIMGGRPLGSGMCLGQGHGGSRCCDWPIGIYLDLESGHSGSSAWEDSGQNPGVKGLGSSAWKGGGVYLLWVRFQHPVPVVKGFGVQQLQSPGPTRSAVGLTLWI